MNQAYALIVISLLSPPISHFFLMHPKVFTYEIANVTYEIYYFDNNNSSLLISTFIEPQQ